MPADHFYEWNHNREKNIFRSFGVEPLFLADFCDIRENEERFVILTTGANDSMRPVHDRMPVILERDEIEAWIFSDRDAGEILHRVPRELRRETPYEQMSLF